MSDTPRTDEHIEKMRDNWWQTDITIPFRKGDFDEMKVMETELAATQILLHESLIREDRFYRELVAAKAEIAVLRFDQEVHQSWFGSK